MNRLFFLIPLFLIGCGAASDKPAVAAPKPMKLKITQFYSPTPKIAKGQSGQICYGVEGAKELELTPPVEKLWPAVARCFDVKPTGKTEYALKATGEDGKSESKTLTIAVGAAAPRVYDLWISALDVQAGQPVQLCFKTENARKINISAGKLNLEKGCLLDNPMKTTTYKVTAIGGDNEIDTGSVTVKVHP